jgi:hypothetical protein
MTTSDNLVKYTGQSIPELGIANGMSMDIVFNRLLSSFLELKNQKVELDGSTFSPMEAISTINNKASNITSDNIRINGDFEIGTSMATQPFLDKSFTYNIDLSGNNLTYSFNYNSIKDNLPSGYNLIYIRTTASSIQSAPNTLIQDNDKLSGVVSIPFDKLPANVKTDIRFNTPQGDILLSTTNPIISAVKSTGTIVLDIKDLTTNKQTNSSITDWSKSLTSQINNISNIKNQLDQFTLGGFENVPDQKGIFNCIGTLSSICDSVIKNVKDLSTVSIPNFGTCVGSTTGSPQDAIDALSKVYLSQKEEISTLKGQLDEQNKSITNLTGFYSSIVNSPSGGSLSTQEITGSPSGGTVITGGSCPGGRCS